MIQIGQPGATIDQPVEHLMACHRRIEARLTTLERAGDQLETNSEAALDAINKSILFLETSGALHTEDEEVSLFPRLRPLLTPDELAYVESLEAQHREAEATFEKLKHALHEGAYVRYRECAARLAAIYRPHIQSEDQVLTGMARRLFDEQQLHSISGEMRQRRDTRGAAD